MKKLILGLSKKINNKIPLDCSELTLDFAFQALILNKDLSA